MKKMIILSYIALALTLGLPYLSAEIRGNILPEETALPQAAEIADEPSAPTALPETAVEAAPEPVSETLPETAYAPAPETVSVLCGGEVITMGMNEYLTGVVAAEMPASFPDEALKAQAVAARTYAMYCAASSKHGEAQVCTDFACCQAWQSDDTMREKWGADYDLFAEKIRSAVESTHGQYLSYQGQPVFAAFHSSSAGATEASGNVWNAVPYLVSVESPESAKDVPNYVSVVDCAALDFRDTVLSECPNADFSGEESTWIREIVRDESGRVSYAVVGGVSIKGTELRQLFSLRSTAFTLEYKEGRFIFTVTGYGHGVGMSQYGASVMAANGAGYEEILMHYYPGTVLVK